MAIWARKEMPVIVQGITGRQGRFHTGLMLQYGTRVVAGVTPGKEGEKVEGIPVYSSVARALREVEAEASIVFVPAPVAAEAVIEAADTGIELVVCITEGIPQLEMCRLWALLEGKETRVIGPNCPGIITPGETKIGIMPADIHRQGRIGVVSRSGTLTYEAVHQLSLLDIGQSTCVGIGGDPMPGTTMIDVLQAFKEDEGTEAVLLIGEIGGMEEEKVAAYMKEVAYPKPVFAFIAGKSAPPGRRMGHAGAIIEGGRGTALSKIEALRGAGATIIDAPFRIGETIAEEL